MTMGSRGMLIGGALLAVVWPALGQAKERAQPQVRADRGPIHTGAAVCKADMDGLFEDSSGAAAARLCALRKQHVRARARLRAALGQLVATFEEMTNQDHADNLPDTIDALQGMVGDCVHALESQQWCHNQACATLPEDNAILCETKAAEIAEMILHPDRLP